MTRLSSPIAMRLAPLLAALSLFAHAEAPPPGDCPQPRFNGKAPEPYLSMTMPAEIATLDLKRAERIFLGSGDEMSCATCHGRKGDGKGPMADDFMPRPRNFSCPGALNGVPEGQLFWLIRFGSPNSGMPPHPKLTDTEIWSVIRYVKTLARR